MRDISTFNKYVAYLTVEIFSSLLGGSVSVMDLSSHINGRTIASNRSSNISFCSRTGDSVLSTTSRPTALVFVFPVC